MEELLTRMQIDTRKFDPHWNDNADLRAEFLGCRSLFDSYLRLVGPGRRAAYLENPPTHALPFPAADYPAALTDPALIAAWKADPALRREFSDFASFVIWSRTVAAARLRNTALGASPN